MTKTPPPTQAEEMRQLTRELHEAAKDARAAARELREAQGAALATADQIYEAKANEAVAGIVKEFNTGLDAVQNQLNEAAASIRDTIARYLGCGDSTEMLKLVISQMQEMLGGILAKAVADSIAELLPEVTAEAMVQMFTTGIGKKVVTEANDRIARTRGPRLPKLTVRHVARGAGWDRGQ